MIEEVRIAVLVSGQGTNLQAIINAQAGGSLGPAKVVLVISDKLGVPALEKAENAGIKTAVLERKSGMEREDFDNLIADILRKEKIDLIALAGFMRVLGKNFVKEFSGKIINVHPAILPSFKGTSGISDAFESGVKITGVTVHFVDEGVDSGPIIAQSVVVVEETDTEETLESKIHKNEHELYPEAIRLFAEGRLRVEGKKVKIISKETI
ncbi:MAG: phosphoribosylglycinamide formyltransferase [Desulfobacula sp.]|nr:phosphoribosylglycinamide formyltransferase [Desulfobacula sp.]